MHVIYHGAALPSLLDSGGDTANFAVRGNYETASCDVTQRNEVEFVPRAIELVDRRFYALQTAHKDR